MAVITWRPGLTICPTARMICPASRTGSRNGRSPSRSRSFLGETFYWPGNELSDLATVGGESAFVGKSESAPAVGHDRPHVFGRLPLVRPGRVPLLGRQRHGHAYYNSWQPIAVLCRQWDSTFASGQKVPRTLGIFNDTHDAQAITLNWTVSSRRQKDRGPQQPAQTRPRQQREV